MTPGALHISFIYKITNNINNKHYIGKTNSTIEQRWQEHISSSNQNKEKYQAIHWAIRKYGKDNFTIEEIEECLPEDASDREIYWIEYYNAFKGHHYNCTRGGDGRSSINYQDVIDLYLKHGVCVKVAEEMGIDQHTVSIILKNYNIKVASSSELYSKPVRMISLEGEEVMIFDNITQAGHFIDELKGVKGSRRSIQKVCKNDRKTAYGYYWELINYSNG